MLSSLEDTKSTANKQAPITSHQWANTGPQKDLFGSALAAQSLKVEIFIQYITVLLLHYKNTILRGIPGVV